MLRLTCGLFVGMFVAAIFTNAVAVYLLHDVDAGRMGEWNLAYRELTLEFLVFCLIVAGLFLLTSWIGSMVFRLPQVTPNVRLTFLLGIAVTVIQYAAEFSVRKLSSEPSTDAFLLGYLLLSPICCAAIILLESHKRRAANGAEAPQT